jgi:hypothetical protein
MNINIIEDKHNRLLANFEDSGAEILQYAKVSLTELRFLTKSFIDHPKRRVLVLVPDEGQEFEIEVWDIKERLIGVYDGSATAYTFTEISNIQTGSECYLLDKNYAEVDSAETDASDVAFDGDTTAHENIGFKQVIKGVKGFICFPVLLDRIRVIQTKGNREVEIYLFEEEGE